MARNVTGDLKNYEKEILREEKKIGSLEEKIEQEEDRILKFQKLLMKRISLGRLITKGLGKHEAGVLRRGLLRSFAKKKVIYSMTIIVAVVLVWRGIWHLADATPWISNPIVSVFLGFVILWAVNRYTRLI